MAQIHIHLHQHADPALIDAQVRIAVAIERIADQSDQAAQLAALAQRLDTSNKGLEAVVAANPDPDPAS